MFWCKSEITVKTSRPGERLTLPCDQTVDADGVHKAQHGITIQPDAGTDYRINWGSEGK